MTRSESADSADLPVGVRRLTNGLFASDTSSPWPDREAELLEHYADGKRTLAIARAMDLTRGQIAGYLHRLSLANRLPERETVQPKTHSPLSPAAEMRRRALIGAGVAAAKAKAREQLPSPIAGDDGAPAAAAPLPAMPAVPAPQYAAPARLPPKPADLSYIRWWAAQRGITVHGPGDLGAVTRKCEQLGLPPFELIGVRPQTSRALAAGAS